MYRWFCLLLLCLALTACYNQASQTPDAWSLTEEQQDSISFYSTHHYTQNFNFVVKNDSLVLYALRSDQKSDDNANAEANDSVVVAPGDRVVVADITYVTTDTIDSVWVKLAHDQMTQGYRKAACCPTSSPTTLYRGSSTPFPTPTSFCFLPSLWWYWLLTACCSSSGARPG